MAELPDDVTEDILTSLPVKSLLRFRCVSKSFCTLIDSPDFIKRHLNRSFLTKTNHKLVLGSKQGTPNGHLYSVDLYKLDQIVELNHPCATKIIGSVNGILCLYNRQKDIVFWNLATRRYHKLPVSKIEFSSPPEALFPVTFISYGFGYDSVSDDYKLLRLVYINIHDAGNDLDFSSSETKVYSLRSNSWQKIQDFPYFFSSLRGYGVLACGALHWMVSLEPRTDMTNLIAAFDLATNKFRLVDYPKIPKEGVFNVGHLEECLCLLWLKSCERVDVWVMKDYGVKESWSKLFTVSQAEVIDRFLLVGPLAYSKNGTEIMWLQDYKKIIWYSLEEERLRTAHLRGCPDYLQSEVCVVQSQVCVESLVPLIGKAENYAKKKSKTSAKEKQIKDAKKRDHSLISRFSRRIEHETGFVEVITYRLCTFTNSCSGFNSPICCFIFWGGKNCFYCFSLSVDILITLLF